MGSGKTISALSICELYKKKIVVICPLSVINIFTNEIVKMKLNCERYKIFNYEKMSSILKKNMHYLKNKLIIIDEAHRLRNVPYSDNKVLHGNALIISSLK